MLGPHGIETKAGLQVSSLLLLVTLIVLTESGTVTVPSSSGYAATLADFERVIVPAALAWTLPSIRLPAWPGDASAAG